MGIKRMLRAILIIFLIFVVVFVIITNSKYLWKIFGFVTCEKPENITVHSIVKDYANQTINIKGTIKDTQEYYAGYLFNVDAEGKMSLGLKYNKYFGYESKDKDFDLQIPCDLDRIKNIYLVNGANEVKIWPVGV